jgi:hypothetical protein
MHRNHKLQEEMNEASTIRKKILQHALKVDVSQKNIDKYGEEVVNRRILTPLCLIGVAYDFWQDKLKNIQFRQECKMHQKKIHALFHNGIFSRNGVMYGALSEDEIYYMSELSDKLADEIKQDMTKLYYTLQAKSMDMQTEQREVFCNILLMETILLVTQSCMLCDWNCKYPALDKAIKSAFLMARMYRQQCLGADDKDIAFTDDDKDFINSVKIIHKKIFDVAV